MNNLPATVGGGGTHADGKVPRFREDDFRVLSDLGPIEGATLVDWPIGYDDVKPYYAEAERLIGVAGEAGANPFAAPRDEPYPMPPGAPMYCAVVTTAAAERLGYHPYPGPTACNSVPYDDRPACNNCGFCAYFGCPIHAKGDPVASLRRALMTREGRAAARIDGLEDPWWRTARPPAWSGSTPPVSATSKRRAMSCWRRGPPRHLASCSCRASSTPRSVATSCTTSKRSPSGSSHAPPRP